MPRFQRTAEPRNEHCPSEPIWRAHHPPPYCYGPPLTLSSMRPGNDDGLRIYNRPSESSTLLKSSVFWDTNPWSPVIFNRRFGGTYCLHLQGRGVGQARNLYDERNKQTLHVGFLLGLHFDSEDVKNTFLRNVGVLSASMWHYIPEDAILHSHCREKLKSHTADYSMLYFFSWGETEPTLYCGQCLAYCTSPRW
jgi:hypothetical protein